MPANQVFRVPVVSQQAVQQLLGCCLLSYRHHRTWQFGSFLLGDRLYKNSYTLFLRSLILSLNQKKTLALCKGGVVMTLTHPGPKPGVSRAGQLHPDEVVSVGQARNTDQLNRHVGVAQLTIMINIQIQDVGGAVENGIALDIGQRTQH